MSWQSVLSEGDYRLYRENISLLEDRIISNFPDIYRNSSILSAIRNVPRHLFVNQSYRTLAYTDNAFPTLAGLTTSAPSVIAEMIFHVGVKAGDRLLEIGTGTGYEAAVLAEMGVNVFSVEIDRQLIEQANKLLVRLGYKIDRSLTDERKRKECLRHFNEARSYFRHRGRIRLFWGNGQIGLEALAPFKAIIVAASVPHLKYTGNLARQLSTENGRLIVPVGSRVEQSFRIVERTGDKLNTYVVEGIACVFVRMVLKQES